MLDSLGIQEPVDWVGNALGGHVGILFAASYPDRCRSLAVPGAPVHGPSLSQRPRGSERRPTLDPRSDALRHR
ncbi:alpha/beta fold hydrolase [Sinomonas notoginsengisoli]|uniref:alpha/beta fold hydrolase n=1 Tax=Sinomonas notoginsengisoli TaxID=1457311 RepID=UPI001F16046F|nr:hypothetical protein [Sinomonas notoginsengisoli]